MDELVIALCVPLGICVLMPIMIVWLISRAKTIRAEKKMDVLMKAVENGADVDQSLFEEVVEKKPKNIKTILMNKLGTGVMMSFMGFVFTILAACDVTGFSSWGLYVGIPFFAIGLGNLVSFFFGMRIMKPEIEAEEEK